ncbi:hypothetical protein MXB_5120, partial [Myxobolus squamalis]
VDLDPSTMLYYMFKRNQLLRSMHENKLIAALKLFKKDTDCEIERLKKSYEAKNEYLENQIKTPLAEQVQNKVIEFTKDYAEGQNLKLLAAISKQREELESNYKVARNIFQANTTILLENDYMPIIANIRALRTIIEENNKLVLNFKNNTDALRKAYSMRMIMNSRSSKIPAIGDYLDYISSHLNDPTISSIISVFPETARLAGLHSEEALIKDLPQLVSKAQRLVFSGDRPNF